MKYEAYINTQHITGWYPVKTNMIHNPERIPEYIKKGILRKITDEQSGSLHPVISRQNKKCWAVVTIEKMVIGKDIDELYRQIDEIGKEKNIISISVTTEKG